MLQLRLRVVGDAAQMTSTSRILPAQTITYTDALNVTATLDFTVDRADFVPTETPFVVRVEYAADDGVYHALPKANTFAVSEVEDDSAAMANIATYRGVEFPIWLLSGDYIHHGPYQKENVRTVNGDGNNKANAGQIMQLFCIEGKRQGSFPQLYLSFSDTHDSGGNPWQASDKVEIGWNLATFLDEVLNRLTEDGYCEWSTDNASFHLNRTGTLGSDKSNLVIGGPGYTSMRVKEDYTEIYNHVQAIYSIENNSEATSNWVDAGAPESAGRWGRRSTVLTQSGVANRDEAVKIMYEHLAKKMTPTREEVYTWVPTSKEVHPFRDIINGDTITAVARGARTARRIVGITAIQSATTNNGWAEVQVRVGDRITGERAKNQKILNSIVGNASIGGSGNILPSTPPMVGVLPHYPAALAVTSNTAEWIDLIIPRSRVELSWSPVLHGVTADAEADPIGPEVNIVQYEVWSREYTGQLSRDAAVGADDTSVVIESWAPGVPRLVAIRALSDRGRWSSFAPEVSVTPELPASLIPTAPGPVTVVSTTNSWTAAGATTTVVLDWPNVAESVDEVDIVIDHYEIWEDERHTLSVPTSAATLSFPYVASKSITVRAVAEGGQVSDPSAPVTVTGALPTVVSLTPTQPTAVTGAGVVSINWDGNYTTTPVPPSAHVVAVERQVGTSWAVVGTTLSGAGSVTVSSEVGTTEVFRFRAYDKANRPTGTSATRSITVTGIELADLDDAVTDILAELESDVEFAITAADGKSTIYHQTTMPTTGKLNDTWYDTDDGNRMYKHNGTTFVIAPYGTNALSDLAITNAKIANLDAAKVTTGILNADRVGAKTLTAQKLAIGDFENIAHNGDFSAGKTSWTGSGTVVTSTTEPNYLEVTTAASGNNDQENVHQFEAKQGDKFYVSFEVWGDPANTSWNNLNILLTLKNDANANVAWPAVSVPAATVQADAGTWITKTGIIEATHASTRKAVVCLSASASGGAGKKYRYRNVVVRRMTTGELIVDGTVRARHIEMDTAFADKFFANTANIGRINVDMLAPNVGQTLNLSANDSITLIAGRQDTQDTTIAQALETATTAEALAAEATVAASTASAAAAAADGKALVAQATAETVRDEFTNHRAVFRVTPTVAEVATTDNSNVLRLTPDGIQIVQGGTIASTWSAGRFIVNEAVVNRLEVANHMIEKQGTRTTFRPL